MLGGVQRSVAGRLRHPLGWRRAESRRWSTLSAGAIADGDLGTHFPEDDPDAQDARSLDFVEHLAGLVRAAGYEIANVDTSVVILGTTKELGRPRLEGMRINLAGALAVDASQVSVKARSNDGLGDAGTGRACEAWATVLIYPATD